MIVKVRELYIELDHFPFYMLDIDGEDVVLKMWYDLSLEPQTVLLCKMDFALWAKLMRRFKYSISRNKLFDFDKWVTNEQK